MMDAYSIGYASGAGIALAFLAIIYLSLFAFFIAAYVFGALGLYRMAKNRGIENPWLAWVPIGSTYLTIKLVEPFSIGGRVINHFAAIYLLTYIASIFSMMFFAFLMILSPIFILFIILIWLAMIALSVIMYVVYYRIFKQYSPDNAVLFLVLTIVLGAAPFILFVLRNKTAVTPLL